MLLLRYRQGKHPRHQKERIQYIQYEEKAIQEQITNTPLLEKYSLQLQRADQMLNRVHKGGEKERQRSQQTNFTIN